MTTPNRFYVYVLYRDEEHMRPFYVGKGCGDRYRRHSYDAFYTWKKSTNQHKNAIIKKCIAEFGEVPCEFYAQNLSEREALAIETALVMLWGRAVHGGVLTNTTNGGEGISGYTHLPGAREQIALKNTGQKRTPEQRAKISAWQIGRKMSEQARAKMRLAKLGTQWSEETHAAHAAARAARGPVEVSVETRAKISAAKKGCVFSDETRQKMSDAAKARTDDRGCGVPRSEETKRKLSAANMGHKHSDETRAKMRGRKCSDETRAKMSESHKLRWAKRQEETV